MRKIAIVGGGQAGLPLALSLLDRGYDVTVVTNRTPDAIRNGRVMSSQCMFGESLAIEQALGLDAWAAQCPPVEGISLAVPHPAQPGAKAIDWAARLDRVAMAVDQRLKMPAWMAEVERRGGRLVIEDVGVDGLERLTETHDLVVLAAGKGEVVQRFERDAARSPYDRPQRALALTYVTGMKTTPEFSRVAFNLIPGVGEYFVFPALTLSGPCDIMVFEGIPGGPMDCWSDVTTPQAHLARSLEILNRFLPWEADRCRQVELTDAHGILAGRFAPTVRKPVMRLPSGRLVFGLGDALITNDPITGQGSNTAMKASKVWLDAIIARGDQPYTADWMQATYDSFWPYAQAVVNWTNGLLAPPPPHILELLGAAQAHPSIASAITNGFDHPPAFAPWWFEPAACAGFIREHAAARAA